MKTVIKMLLMLDFFQDFTIFFVEFAIFRSRSTWLHLAQVKTRIKGSVSLFQDKRNN